MVMLGRALGIEPIENPNLTQFTDGAQVASYARGMLAALIRAGIVGGVTADQLAPQNNITRAATVTILDRAIGTYADKAGETVNANGKGIVLAVADDVTITGEVNKLLVPANDIEVTVKGSKNIDYIVISGDNSKVILDNASADNVTLDGEKSAVETKNGAKIDNVIVTENAPGATVDVGSGTTVGNVENHAEDATVTGSGTVKKVESDKDITVRTKETDVKNIGDEKITVTDKSGKDTTVGTTGSGSSTTVNKGTTSSGGGSYTPPAQHTHTWDAGVVTKEATCTEAGVKTYTCTVCKETKTEAINATGHTPVDVAEKPATCTEAGHKAGTKCSVCEAILSGMEEIPTTGHTEVIDAAKAPTCTETGLTEGKHCYACGEVITAQETVPAKGHTEVVDPVVEATCTKPGKTEGKHCSVCNEVLVAQKVVSAKGHDWDSGKILKQPTYGENGEMLYTCAICDEYKTEIIPKLVNGGGGTGGAGGGSSSAGSTTKTEESTTKTETKPDGTVVETTTGKDGSTSKTTTKKDGSSVTESKTADGTTGTVKTDKDGKTEAEAKISNKAVEDAKKSSEAVKVPTEVKAGKDSNSAPTVKVELPKNAGETKIEIPVTNVKPGTVAVLVHPDGTEEIVKNSKPTEDGVQLTVDGNTVVKIIDNSKDFIDTRNHWSRDEVNFVASRDIFNGVGNNLFGVSQPMTRGMVNTVLARLAGIDTTPKNGQKWYEVGTEWAKSKGITDGTNPEASVTREQLATLLYRFYGSPAISGTLRFADAGAVSAYAQDALLWATQNGIMNGVGNNCVAPSADAQRAQVAAMMARYLKNAD